MEFDIGSFSSKFKDTIDWMVKGKFGQKIKDDLQSYQRLRNELSVNQDASEVLKLLVETKVTHSFYRPLLGQRREEFEVAYNSLMRNHKQNLRSPQAMRELRALIIKYDMLRDITDQGAKEWIERLLSDYPTMKELTEELYSLRKQGKNNGLLGNKGVDHYLREVGYWDIIPIDIHEKRFLIRTGIYHMFSVQGKQDPFVDRYLQNALTEFCPHHLKSKTVEGIDLGSAPGILDLLIWSYCSNERYKICGSRPRCGECGLKDACLFGITNVQKATTQGRIKASEKLEPDKGIIIDAWIVDPEQKPLKNGIAAGLLRLEISITGLELRKVISAYRSHYGTLLNARSYSGLPRKNSAVAPIALLFGQEKYRANLKKPEKSAGAWIPNGPLYDKSGNDVKLSWALKQAGFPVKQWTSAQTNLRLPKQRPIPLQSVQFEVTGERWAFLSQSGLPQSVGRPETDT